MKRLAVLLVITGLLASSVACGREGPSQSDSETASPEGVTWVLQTMYGAPVVDGTFVWLRIDGDDYGGVDGCNRYGGANRNGRPVVGDKGDFDPQPMYWTEALCEFPDGVMEQADEYRRLLGRQGQSFRVEGDRLEILDWEGESGLVFVRQVPLEGEPVDLAGTEWQQVGEDGAGEDVRAATIVFLDDNLAVGITACRGYAAYYQASGGRLKVPSTAMTEYGTSTCDGESRMHEGEFTTDLSRAIEYSVSNEDGTRRLRIRTSRGRTLTFEALGTEFKGVSGGSWGLRAFLTVAKWGDPDAPLLRADRLIPESKVTIRFHRNGASGFGGCNSYSAKLEPEESIAREDGTFAKGLMALESTSALCLEPPGVDEQEKRFTELIPRFESYRMLGDLLVVHTNDDVVLLFQR